MHQTQIATLRQGKAVTERRYCLQPQVTLLMKDTEQAFAVVADHFPSSCCLLAVLLKTS